jgi:hypothetical protein
MPPPNGQKPIYFQWEIEEVKEYYLLREKWYELAILAGVVLAFFLGLAI